MVDNEKEMIAKMNIDMACLDVPYEVLRWVDGLGFSNYDCNLDCKNCEYLEEL